MGLEIIDHDVSKYGLNPIQVWDKRPLVFTGTGNQGFTNMNLHLVDATRDEFFLRMPQNEERRAETIRDTEIEMGFTGFLACGGEWHMRTPDQQANFSQHASALELRVIPLYHMKGHQGLIMPYIKGASTLRAGLLAGKAECALEVLTHLRSAHAKGIVFGDRWTNNTLVTPDGNFFEIDYDIELRGNHAKELELAQFLFHLVHFSIDRGYILHILDDHFRQDPLRKEYNIKAVTFFMKNYIEHHGNIGTYEGLSVASQTDIDPLINALS